MRKQYHFKKVGSDIFVWDVESLLFLSKKLPIKQVNLSEINEFYENYWYQFPKISPTCKSICEHIKLIEEANLKYPILLNNDNTLIDGMHRVCKAHHLQKKAIKAKRFTKMPKPDYINIDPIDLKY